jgi:single-strand DNA-binding protein
MASLNKVFLMGNMTRDPELRYTPSGQPVCEFGLAINREYTKSSGERVEDTCFVDVTMWGRRGEVISEYLSKGDPIFVEGRLQYDSWEGQDGRRRSKLKVTAVNFEFIGRGGSGGGGGGGGSQGGGYSQGQSRGGQGGSRGGQSGQRRSGGQGGRQASQQQPEESYDEGFDVADDEIPF